MDTTIAVKNMVCPRCIKAVRQIFEKHGQKVRQVTLGSVVLANLPAPGIMEAIQRDLQEEGFEVLDDKQQRIIDRIKTEIIEVIHYQPEKKPANQPFSQFLSDKLHADYSALSKLFSSTEGRTIERFIIAQKIEKVKELLIYDELTLSEIAYKLDYSSVQHLSAQFRKETGFSPSAFKKAKKQDRKPLDKL